MRILLLLFICCGTTLAAQHNPLAEVIDAHRQDFGPWVDHPDSFEVQVLYTQIDRHDDGSVRLHTYRWGADSTQYFYPASTVKMPVAVLALQKLNELGVLGLTSQSTLLHGEGHCTGVRAPICRSYGYQQRECLPSIANYLRRIFLTSDNDAYNRLFEWLGPTYINKALQRVGIAGARIQHRVGVSGFDDTTHAYLNPVRFMDGYDELYQIGERHDTYYDPLPNVRGQQRGVGFMRNDSLINGPLRL